MRIFIAGAIGHASFSTQLCDPTTMSARHDLRRPRRPQSRPQNDCSGAKRITIPDEGTNARSADIA